MQYSMLQLRFEPVVSKSVRKHVLRQVRVQVFLDTFFDRLFGVFLGGALDAPLCTFVWSVGFCHCGSNVNFVVCVCIRIQFFIFGNESSAFNAWSWLPGVLPKIKNYMKQTRTKLTAILLLTTSLLHRRVIEIIHCKQTIPPRCLYHRR